jgi:hypothetical protein
MRCKQGDLAIMVYSAAGNEGKIVRCIRLAKLSEYSELLLSRELSPWWIVDRALMTTWGRVASVVPDAFLRPIRNPGDDEVDEMVAKLGPALFPKEFEKRIQEFLVEFDRRYPEPLDAHTNPVIINPSV